VYLATRSRAVSAGKKCSSEPRITQVGSLRSMPCAAVR
jgi:hypothetical protein